MVKTSWFHLSHLTERMEQKKEWRVAKGSQVKKKRKSDMDPERRRNSGGKNESRFKLETYLVREN